MSSHYRIAQITDLHLPKNGDSWVHGVDTVAGFRRVMERIGELRPDLVLVTGDIAESGDGEAYVELQTALDRFEHRMVLPGNHDLGEAYPKFFNNDPIQVRRVGRWTLLGLNSAEEVLTEDQKARCLEILEANDCVLLILHHPLIKLGRALFDDVWVVKNRDEFYQALRFCPSLKGVVFGHTHATHRIQDGHVRHLGSPATSFYLEAHSTRHTFEMIEKHAFQWIELADDIQADVHFV